MGRQGITLYLKKLPTMARSVYKQLKLNGFEDNRHIQYITYNVLMFY